MSGGYIKTKRAIERGWYIISSLGVIIVLLLSIGLVSLRLFGLQMFTVTSGSMEPKFPVGSLIYTAPVSASELKVGDVITFMNTANSTVTHRISEIVSETNSSTGEETLRFRTKGDANNSSDGKLVHEKNIIGTPVVTIPLLGFASYYLQRPPGLYIALIVGTFLISMIIIPSVYKHKGKEQTISRQKHNYII